MTTPNGFRPYTDSDNLTPGQKVFHPVMGYPGIFIEHVDCDEVRCVFSADDGVENVPIEGLCVPDIPPWTTEQWSKELERWQSRAGLFNEVILEVVDTIGLRYDSLFPNPDIKPGEARVIVAKALRNYAEQITGLNLDPLGDVKPTAHAFAEATAAAIDAHPTNSYNARSALAHIIEVRDYHAEHGRFPDGTVRSDQMFDDWAADLAEKALGSRENLDTRFLHQVRMALASMTGPPKPDGSGYHSGPDTVQGIHTMVEDIDAYLADSPRVLQGSVVKIKDHDHDRHGPEAVVVQVYPDGRALACSVPASDSFPKWKYAPVGVYNIKKDFE